MSGTPDAKRDANQIEFATTMSDIGNQVEQGSDGPDDAARHSLCLTPRKCRDLAYDLAAANATIAEYREDVDAVLREACGSPDEQHCTCVPALRRAVRELTGERDALREVREMVQELYDQLSIGKTAHQFMTLRLDAMIKAEEAK